MLALGVTVAGVGAWIGADYLPEQYRLPARVAGGALTIYGAWLLAEELFAKVKKGGGVLDAATELLVGPTKAGTYSEEALPAGTEAVEPSGGVKVGGSVSGVIVAPADGSSATRNPFSSKVAATFELENRSSEARVVFAEAVCSVYRSVAADTFQMRTPLGSIELAAGEVRRLEALVETGDVQTILFETGAGTAALALLLNGATVHAVTFSLA
jgi:hypothetical protein